MQKNKKTTLVAIGMILLLIGVIGLSYGFHATWMDILVVLGAIGIIWGWLEKGGDNENMPLKTPWVKALTLAVIFLLIFLAGMLSGHSGILSMRYQTGGYHMGGMNGDNMNSMPMHGSGGGSRP